MVSPTMSHIQIALPLGRPPRHIVIIPLAISKRDIALPAQEEEHRLLEAPRAVEIAQQARRPDSDVLDARVVNLRVGLDAAAGESRGGDAAGVDVRPLALARVVGDEVDGLAHDGVVGAAAAAGGAADDDEHAVGGELREEGRLAEGVGRAGAVAPDHDGELGAGGDVLGREEGVTAERVGGVVALGRGC